MVNMAASSSSTKKGETLHDTMATLNAMHADVVVIRHGASGAPRLVAQRSRASVVNAGDGTFGGMQVVPNSSPDESEVDFIDYDGDGDLDVYVANFAGQDRIHENDGWPANPLIDQPALLPPFDRTGFTFCHRSFLSIR